MSSGAIYWTDGLATYASAQLNPGASDAELLLEIPEPMRPKVEANRTAAVCTTLAWLDSTDQDRRNMLLSASKGQGNLPPRFGYLVGMWVAEDLGRTRSLSELAEWSGPELRTAIERSLRGMADCSGPDPAAS